VNRKVTERPRKKCFTFLASAFPRNNGIDLFEGELFKRISLFSIYFHELALIYEDILINENGMARSGCNEEILAASTSIDSHLEMQHRFAEKSMHKKRDAHL